ncbi:MAG: sigma-70 family RNA polymerase sigma factor [Myxococcales bacterium FL481]|nr:MAG: sigma-70 family RNA polymerase sigma factor [Myxococcales bacterium FL481]
MAVHRHHVDAANGPAPHEAQLARLYDQHVDFVWRLVCRRGIPEPAAEDVVHEVFLVLHRRLPQLDTRANIRGWLYRATLNVVRHQQRSHMRRERAYARYPVSGAAPDPGFLDPEGHVARRQARAFVERFLATLDPDKRRVFVLIDIEGIPPADVASLTGTSVNTVYSRLRAARQRFESCVARQHRREGKRHHA